MGSQNQAALQDPVATAPGSDTGSLRLGNDWWFETKPPSGGLSFGFSRRVPILEKPINGLDTETTTFATQAW